MLFVLLSLLTPLAFTGPVPDPPVSTFTPTSIPRSSYPNGTANPFYPCGSTASQISACPYRCYTASGSLRPQCFTRDAAKQAIDSLDSICVKCVRPSVPEDVPPNSCQPLSTYFDQTAPPSFCGFAGHRIRSCAWICGEAQVPFSVCSATDTTGTFSLCRRCIPLCSSPRIVFDPPLLPRGFSVSGGNCSTRYGPPERVACPWRCKFAGILSGDSYCSLTDRTGSFTTCTRC